MSDDPWPYAVNPNQPTELGRKQKVANPYRAAKRRSDTDITIFNLKRVHVYRKARTHCSWLKEFTKDVVPAYIHSGVPVPVPDHLAR